MINSCHQRTFYPNSVFNKNRKARWCATYVFAYCHKPAMTTHQIFHITKPKHILCLITTLIYQLGYISCSVMRCVGASQKQTMAVTKHLFSFRKPRNWKHLFSDSQQSNLTSYLLFIFQSSNMDECHQTFSKCS